MSIKDNPYFRIVEPQVLIMPEPPADQVLAGEFWSIHLRSGRYFLEYVSGEHAGREKCLEISDDEFAGLAEGKFNIDQILIRHGAN